MTKTKIIKEKNFKSKGKSRNNAK